MQSPDTLQLHVGRERVLPLDRPIIMGVLNVTPDSFSDGGRYTDPAMAVEHALSMIDQGAAIIDVGGESTRPGAQRVDAGEQINRVQHVIAQLHAAIDRAGSSAIISIDTTLSDVAQAALDAGAVMVNDVSAGRDDPRLFELVAQRQAALVIMHMLGAPATMQDDPTYHSVTDEVEAFLLERIAAARAAGVLRRQIVIDPGIGFGKTIGHNLTLLADLDRFVAGGYPVLLGASRKRALRALCGVEPESSDPMLGATCATTALGAAVGVRLFRVHDVAPNVQAARIAWAVRHHGAR